MIHIQSSTVYKLSLFTTAISFLALWVLVGADAYVRWNLNQDFTFLGDYGILALAIVFTGQMAALIITSRSSH